MDQCCGDISGTTIGSLEFCEDSKCSMVLHHFPVLLYMVFTSLGFQPSLKKCPVRHNPRVPLRHPWTASVMLLDFRHITFCEVGQLFES